MPKNELKNIYFEWMCGLVGAEFDCGGVSYYKLLNYLHNRDFDYTIAMDGNRAEDGIDLRYRFACENDFDAAIVEKHLNNCPCSILEMMVALAIRCEESIMNNPEIGDRTGEWFWDMIENLGLADMNDGRFDEEYTDYIITRFLQRKYAQNGRGGLFFIENCRRNLRNVEIWCQAMWYLDSLL